MHTLAITTDVPVQAQIFGFETELLGRIPVSGARG